MAGRIITIDATGASSVQVKLPPGEHLLHCDFQGSTVKLQCKQYGQEDSEFKDMLWPSGLLEKSDDTPVLCPGGIIIRTYTTTYSATEGYLRPSGTA
jgi:hypothetical protein